MGNRVTTVQEWFSRNQEELIHCPYQLGNLKITKSSCLKQRRKSSEWTFTGTADNYILFAFEKHLEVCRQCDQMESVGLNQDTGSNRRRFQKMGRSPGHNPRVRGAATGKGMKSRKEQPLGHDLHYREQYQTD
ncbi:MAG: hypothetical protein HY892_02440 [Deltaproteobacteria bacterium]|nr:hypothetical protein [Deltaproteobacteria bacterium]